MNLNYILLEYSHKHPSVDFTLNLTLEFSSMYINNLLLFLLFLFTECIVLLDLFLVSCDLFYSLSFTIYILFFISFIFCFTINQFLSVRDSFEWFSLFFKFRIIFILKNFFILCYSLKYYILNFSIYFSC